ncbi:MAG: phosphoribosylformylglycinamidine synthase subunit PurS [Coriobacteriia bacterium]|nr:phosphoribosylformylglycinamidine synthase subunit PurS [Coriobacteriia bacterium]
MAQYQIYVTYKQGIFDPAGATAERALQQMEFDEVNSVRIGKYITLEVAGAADAATRARVETMCEKLLANPVIEDFRIEEAQE